MKENAITLGIGTFGVAFIQLNELKDFVTVLVGIVTIVCLIYTTFFKDKK